MRSHLEAACAAGNAEGAAVGGPLRLPALGPPRVGLPGLPLQVACLPPRFGGIGLPQLRHVCQAAFAAQVSETLVARVVDTHVRAVRHGLLPAPLAAPGATQQAGAAAGGGGEGEVALPAGVCDDLPPLFAAVRGVIRYWDGVVDDQSAAPEGALFSTQYDDDGDALMDFTEPNAASGAAAAADGGESGPEAGAAGGAPGASQPPASPRQFDSPAAPSSPSSAAAETVAALFPAALRAWAADDSPSASALTSSSSSSPSSPRSSSASAPAPPVVVAVCAALGWHPSLRGRAARRAERVVRRALGAGLPQDHLPCDGSRPAGGRGSRRAGGDCDDDDFYFDDLFNGFGMGHAQGALSVVLVGGQYRRLVSDLSQRGIAGRQVAAQLLSQRGRGAMSWLDAPQGLAAMHPLAAVTMVLMTITVDGWGVAGRECHICAQPRAVGAGPTCVHALGCRSQNDRGCRTTHTVVKRALKQLCVTHHAPWLHVEDASPFSVTDCKIDIALAPGSLALAADKQWRSKGLLLDNSVRSPAVHSALKGRRGSASVAGYAAAEAEKAKRERYGGTFDTTRWRLVTVAQESFGRFGGEALAFFKQLASHAAACEGGGALVVDRRRGIVLRRIVATMSSALAAELGERVLAFVTSAAKAGRRVHPVSRLLTFGGGGGAAFGFDTAAPA
jgi:hypothetical protein